MKTFTAIRHYCRTTGLRLDRKVRQEAILLCAMMASTETGGYFGHATMALDLGEGTDWEGVDHPAAFLAREALFEVHRVLQTVGVKTNWAEAECLLRDGWVP